MQATNAAVKTLEPTGEDKGEDDSSNTFHPNLPAARDCVAIVAKPYYCYVEQSETSRIFTIVRFEQQI